MELVESVLKTEAKHSWNENDLGEYYLLFSRVVSPPVTCEFPRKSMI
jgi:hypothetical protein